MSLRKFFGFVAVLGLLSSISAFAGEVVLHCSEHPEKHERDELTFRSEDRVPRDMGDVDLNFRGRRIPSTATINSVLRGGEVMGYIVKDDDMTFKFSGLEKCGTQMTKRSDYARVVVTLLQCAGNIDQIGDLLCTCE
jgi:hypothetical protein